MENTLNEFKNKQVKELQILEKLKKFIEVGEKLGVEIDSTINEINNEIKIVFKPNQQQSKIHQRSPYHPH